MIPVVRTKAALAAAIGRWRKRGLTVGFVPTMGALHEGHAALVRKAASENDRVVVSIFVNPLQFGPAEDYGRYPRALPSDRRLVDAAGGHLVYAPNRMYPKDFRTSVEVAGWSDVCCGKFRPGHFKGVATVVLKLFNQVRPDRAYFGEKDWQQLKILERMVRDLDVPVRIAAVATRRAKDGLALSSRNQYLTEEERAIAPQLRRSLLTGAPLKKPWKLQYSEIFEGRRLAAARLGRTRLIDNVPVKRRR